MLEPPTAAEVAMALVAGVEGEEVPGATAADDEAAATELLLGDKDVVLELPTIAEVAMALVAGVEEDEVPGATAADDEAAATELLLGDKDVVLELGAKVEEGEEDTIPAAVLGVELAWTALEEAKPELAGLVL